MKRVFIYYFNNIFNRFIILIFTICCKFPKISENVYDPRPNETEQNSQVIRNAAQKTCDVIDLITMHCL